MKQTYHLCHRRQVFILLSKSQGKDRWRLTFKQKLWLPEGSGGGLFQRIHAKVSAPSCPWCWSAPRVPAGPARSSADWWQQLPEAPSAHKESVFSKSGNGKILMLHLFMLTNTILCIHVPGYCALLCPVSHLWPFLQQAHRRELFCLAPLQCEEFWGLKQATKAK